MRFLKGKNGEQCLLDLLIMKRMKATFLIFLFPGHLQHSSCVGRVQMFCPESGAAVWHCKTCKTSQELQAFGSSLCAAHVVNHWLLHVGGIA